MGWHAVTNLTKILSNQLHLVRMTRGVATLQDYLERRSLILKIVKLCKVDPLLSREHQ